MSEAMTNRWESDPILKVEHVTMRFGGLVAVNNLSFTVGRGDITALIGPNGAGKTTVFNCITGFYKPTEGRMALIHPRPDIEQESESATDSGAGHLNRSSIFLLERMPDFRVAAEAKVARTFQNIRLFSGMTVLENLLVAQHNRLMRASGYSILGILGAGSYARAEREAMERAKYWLEKTGLTDRADDPAGDLPYGAQRRLEIARAMCTKPVLLCLDEPAAGLNPRESLELNTLLNGIRENEGTSILLIEHDMSVVMEISDHVVVLDYGTKISDGPPSFVKNDPKVIAAYLGVDDEEVETVEAEVEAVLEGSVPSSPKPVPAARTETFGQPLLTVRGVKTYYGNIIALKGVDLDVNEGEIVTLIGANGAGKSTLMMTIFGTPRAREGSIVYARTDITRMASHDIARLRMAQSPEGRRIFPRMSVLENLQMGAAIDNLAHVDEDLERVFRLFPRLKERINQRGGTLSGGEQQMLAIARALMSRPKLLLLDEPSLGLAPLIVKQIFDAIQELNRTEGLTVFLVEQNAFHALKLAHRGYVMVNGVITMRGTGKELLARP